MSAVYSDEAQMLDAVLRKSGYGEILLKQWHDIRTLAMNLDAAELTDKQKNALKGAFSLHFLRETPALYQSPLDCYAAVRYLELEQQEHLVVLVLDRRNRLITLETIYKGSATSAQVRAAEVFRPAIVFNGSAIVLAHNHPSGDPSPSPDDVALTRQLVAAGKLLDIEVLDHIIVGEGRYVSLKERGLGFV